LITKKFIEFINTKISQNAENESTKKYF